MIIGPFLDKSTEEFSPFTKTDIVTFREASFGKSVTINIVPLHVAQLVRTDTSEYGSLKFKKLDFSGTFV